MYLAYDKEYFKVTIESVKEVSYFGCNHEQADRRNFLYPKEALKSKDAVIIICEDTDVYSKAV